MSLFKNKRRFFLFFIILIAALGLRIYKINLPLADHHSWRQADTAAVARNYILEGFDFLRPRIDNMAPLHSSSLVNQERLFLVEPPVYNSIVALLYSFLGINIVVARAVNILLFLGSMVLFYLLVKSTAGERTAFLSLLFLALLPYGIFYSRTVLPEILMLFLSIGMVYFFSLWLKSERWFHFLVALAFIALGLTQKIFPFFLSLPLAYLLVKYWNWSLLNKKKLLKLIFFLVLSLVPFLAWRYWISGYPEGVPSYSWLLNQGNLRFTPAWIRWIFIERIGKLILGVWGLPLLVVGLILKPEKEAGWLYHWWLVAFLIYVTVFAAGNVTHDYYQLPFLPLAAYFLGRGSDFLLFLRPLKFFSRFFCLISFFICSSLMLAFSWYQVKDFYFIQGGVDLAGRAVDQLTPKDALVLTGDSNDATLLYNTNRHGWTGGYASYFPNTPESLEKARSLGAEYYVTTKVGEINNSDFGKYLLNNYKIISQSDQYLVADLRQL